MPLDRIPFYLINGNFRPALPIRIGNPHSGMDFQTYGNIDTGADECCVPADLAELLGHELTAGSRRRVMTAGGPVIAWSHTTRFEIIHPETGDVACIVDNTPIDFIPNLRLVLLGVNSFLSRFILKIDYPQRMLSIKRPKSGWKP
jgi:hypothetical protein